MERPDSSLSRPRSYDIDRVTRNCRLLACVGWLLLHRVVINRGFVFRRRGWSTDTRVALIIGTLSTVWFVSVLIRIGEQLSTTYQTINTWSRICISLVTLSEGPLLVQTLFGFWIMSWADGLRAERDNRRKPHLWSLTNLRGPFDWTSGMHRGYYQILVLVTTLATAIPATAALLYGDPLSGILRLAGLFIFVLHGAADNPYVFVSHRYADDQLRIALPTSHHEGTIYILPSNDIGMDAVWTPKITAENVEADNEMMVLFQQMRSGRWAVNQPLERLRKTLAAYQKRVLLSTEQAERLAAWIYADKSSGNATPRSIHCNRAQNVHLIGRDLMYALCHAEYLVFMAQGRLALSTQSKLAILRLMSRSGAGTIEGEPVHTVGFRPGFAGCKEAVQHVYSIFDLQIDDRALNFESTEPPTYSAALGRAPGDIDDALYFFTTVWFMELGNVNGFHIFPLRCKTKDGDLVSQMIAWRQAWFSGLVAELVASSPALFMVFVTGYLE